VIARNSMKARNQEVSFIETKLYFEQLLGVTDAYNKESYVKTQQGITRIEDADKICDDGPKVFFDKVGQAVFNIVDGKKKALASILLDRWMLFETGEESIYVYHVASEKMNTLYQILLGGKEWDGIYEFSLKGKEVKVKVENKNNRNVLIIESNDNYDAALFENENGEKYSITKMDFKSDEEFKKALLKTGLISEEDLDIYFNPDEIIRPYLNRVLPRVEFR
jgi:hypothetical protein